MEHVSEKELLFCDTFAHEGEEVRTLYVHCLSLVFSLAMFSVVLANFLNKPHQSCCMSAGAAAVAV